MIHNDIDTQGNWSVKEGTRQLPPSMAFIHSGGMKRKPPKEKKKREERKERKKGRERKEGKRKMTNIICTRARGEGIILLRL